MCVPSHPGPRGWRDSPSAAAPRFELHERWAARRFDGVSCPPYSCGSWWSAVNGSARVGGLPQIQQFAAAALHVCAQALVPPHLAAAVARAAATGRDAAAPRHKTDPATAAHAISAGFRVVAMRPR